MNNKHEHLKIEYSRNATDFQLAATALISGSVSISEISTLFREEVKDLLAGRCLKTASHASNHSFKPMIQARTECLEVLAAVMDRDSIYADKWRVSERPPRTMYRGSFEQVKDYLETGKTKKFPKTPKKAVFRDTSKAHLGA